MAKKVKPAAQDKLTMRYLLALLLMSILTPLFYFAVCLLAVFFLFTNNLLSASLCVASGYFIHRALKSWAVIP